MTLTTTFVNKTTLVFKLKEGNAGVYKELGTLEGLASDANAEPTAANKKTLEFDPKATYKEYRVVTGTRAGRVPATFRIIISSDFILGHSTIYIVQDPENSQNYIIQGDPRSNTPSVSGLVATVSKLLKLLKRN